MVPISDLDGREPISNEIAARRRGLRFAEIFAESSIESVNECKDIHAVIRQLVERLAKVGRIAPQHIDAIVKELLQRERFVTSALGRGLAFPHIRSQLVSEFVGAIGVAPDGINLSSLDGRPSKLVILIVSPWEERDRHLGLLSRTVSLMQDKAIQLRMDAKISLSDVWQYLNDLDDRSETSDQRCLTETSKRS